MPSYKASDFIKAIPGTGGIIDVIRKRVGCEWHTAKRYIEGHPTVRQAYDNECERVADMAYSKVIEAIDSGDIATVKWYLTKKRKAEFGDALDVNNAGAVEIVVRYADDKRNDTDSA
jgi:hypothetical protein